jgi:hypothetical protein
MSIRERIEQIMVAITFAEAGEHEMARRLLREQKRMQDRQRPTPRSRPRASLRAPSLNDQG